MKKLLLGAAALVAFAAPAFAADMPARTYTKAPVYTAPAAGLQLDRLLYRRPCRRRVRRRQQPCRAATRRFLGGVQGGFDYQFAPNWVIGAEAQYSWLTDSNNNGVLFPGGTLVTVATTTSSAR